MTPVAPALLIVLCAAGLCFAGQDATGRPTGDDFLGTWSGTWDGAASGRAASGLFEMTIVRAPGGELSGSAVVWPDGADPYDVDLKSVSVEANRVRAVYDAPEPNLPEIVLEGVLDGAAVTGRWSAVRPGRGDAGDGGTWVAARKPRRGGA